MRTIGLFFGEQKPVADKPDYTKFTKAELIELCEEKGIELTPADKRNKQTLIEKL